MQKQEQYVQHIFTLKFQHLACHHIPHNYEGDEHHDFFVKSSLVLKVDQRDDTKYSDFDFVIFIP